MPATPARADPRPGPLLALDDDGGVTVGTVRGPLDVQRAAQVGEVLADAARRTPTPFVLDLGEAAPLPPTALAVLYSVIRRLRADEHVEVLLAAAGPEADGPARRSTTDPSPTTFASRAAAVVAARRGATV